MTATKFDASLVANPIRSSIRQYIDTQMNGVGPLIVGFLATDDASARKYAEWTAKACQTDGIRYELRYVLKDNIEEEIKIANDDSNVHGIMVYYPCFGSFPSFFGGTMDEFLRDTISVRKDVEGLCHVYRGYLYRNIRYLNPEKTKKCVLPCTPLAIVKILEYLKIYNSDLPVGEGLTNVKATVINRSDIVGRPLAALLANDGAEVYSVDIDSIYLFSRGKLANSEETLESACLKSSVIVTGVPSKDYRLPVHYIPDGCVVINVSSYKNVDEAALLERNVTYVPLVGKVTIALLERNLLRLYENFHANTSQSCWQ